MITFVSKSPSETKKIGSGIGRLLRENDVVALEGDLGAGKTTMVKGIAKGLGIASERDVVSPTFVLIHEYPARKKIYHMDWYRLKSVEGADASLAEECFNARGVVLIEWAERGKNILPLERLWIRLKHRGPEVRLITVDAKGRKNQTLLESLKKINPALSEVRTSVLRKSGVKGRPR